MKTHLVQVVQFDFHLVLIPVCYRMRFCFINCFLGQFCCPVHYYFKWYYYYILVHCFSASLIVFLADIKLFL